ncbi:hypothetical protein E1264_18340 [Actinomadura sp. KC216]|uniref:hypothetical protein n=1 Tax=Actinomadura sp. KC216 TaxID=2530370 RepID=UPI00104E9FCC|nr:hypothetical protein [Actinomadura sp. KC216]TDB86330.1 hypothetical protein E1264_18340 [Actinomadura sp. KC216]
MITGYDTVLVCAQPPSRAVRRFVDRLHRDRPDLRVAVEPGDDPSFRRWGPDRDIPAGRAEVLVAEDEEMVQRWDEDGYYLSPTGTGPLMISFEPCRVPRLTARVLENPYGDNGLGFTPYDVTLIGTDLHLVTIVTPDAESPFSTSVIDRLTEDLNTTGHPPMGA